MNNIANRLSQLAALSLFVVSTTVYGITLPNVPMEPIYFEPPVIERNEQLAQLSCVGLDNTIRQMQPYRYSYKAPFYEDNANKIAAALVTVESIPVVKGLAGFGYLAYSSSVEEKEKRRQILVEQRIALLQQLKAEKHCFE